MTVCNMSIEGGARAGMVAPDEKTFAYLEGRPYAPKGKDWEAALDYWRSLPTDEGAKLRQDRHAQRRRHRAERDLGHDAGAERCRHRPHPGPRDSFDDAGAREVGWRSLTYMDLKPGTAIEDIAPRPRVHRLLHQLPHRGPARRRRGRSRLQGGVEACARWWCRAPAS